MLLDISFITIVVVCVPCFKEFSYVRFLLATIILNFVRIKTLFIVENFIVIIKSGIIRDNWQI